MNARVALTALLVPGFLASACSIPKGSNARPVHPVKEGTNTLSVGGLVPFAAAGASTFGDSNTDFAVVADEFTIIPSGAWDYAIGDASTIGVELSVLKSFSSGNSALGVFLNPRFEIPFGGLDRTFAFTIDGNLGFFSAPSAANELVFFPFIAPTIGFRAYIPFGPAGMIISQQFGTGFISVTLPGSISFDIPIPIGDSKKLHFFPEFRWDPTGFYVGDGFFYSLFSGGLTVMIEL